ncbi:ATP-dependent DNA helicase, RecQ family protein [Saprospira grandis str. Lewin]|uniref:ATP-dependent DNA helicase RecQ n=2 Tax=Saprospira TaxID=1007 RepID=H6L5V6_SAPGL|nr:ATP-dependent DNA helicase, RecQ family protein [Saprospira grandis str. Lewin]
MKGAKLALRKLKNKEEKRMSVAAREILKKYWGYPSFRPLQEDIVDAVLAGQDCLALLPTGGGKSVCFQVPALCLGGLCLVVSPLIALMKDQVEQLKRRGISAEAIYTGMRRSDIDRILELAVHGHISFLYVSPERLGTEMLQMRLDRLPIRLLAVDEAHCISQWGYDFRPAYLKIAEIRPALPKVPVIALTATATEQVVADIQEKLAFREEAKAVFRKSFGRDNLAYVVLEEENKLAKLLDMLQKVPGTAVVYVLNRRACREIASYLQKNNISADYYHAGRSVEQRSQIQQAWIANEIRVIVATNAFGMGIDKPDVRLVVHLTLPDNLEAYFQEAGRAGRDGKKAYAVLLYNSTDKARLLQQYEQSYPTLDLVRQVYQALGSFFQLAIGGGEGQSFDFPLGGFCQHYKMNPILVLSALRILMQNEYLILSESLFFPASIQFRLNNRQVYDFALRYKPYERLVQFILRTYQGAFQQSVNIREEKIAKGTKSTISEVKKQLGQLQQAGLLYYHPQKENPYIYYLKPRLAKGDLLFDGASYRFLKERQEKRMQAALAYAEEKRCRSQMLLAYFNELDAPACGQCDVCLGRHDSRPSPEEYKKMRSYMLAQVGKESLSVRVLIGRFPSNLENKALAVLQQLLDNEELVEQANGQLKLN